LAADKFSRPSSGYNEVSIDNKSALCDKNSDDIEEPREPDPLIRVSDLSGTSVCFQDSYLKQHNKIKY
jgi:hypothetical protein